MMRGHARRKGRRLLGHPLSRMMTAIGCLEIAPPHSAAFVPCISVPRISTAAARTALMMFW